MFAPQFNSMLMEKYKTCDYCCYDIVDDSGNIMEHECSNLRKALSWFRSADIPSTIDDGSLYVDVNSYEVQVSQSEIDYRAELWDCLQNS